jgi:Flp pilus assembly protein TadB
MSIWLNIALTTFYVLWLVAVLLFLWMIWRNGASRAEKLETTLSDATLITARAADKAVEAALLLARREVDTPEPEPEP